MQTNENDLINEQAKQIATLRKTNTSLRRVQKNIIESYDARVAALSSVVASLNSDREPVVFRRQDRGTSFAHVELLLSDIQIGKVSLADPEYGTEIAKKRLSAYTKTAIDKIISWGDVYKLDGVTIALLGDIIESDKKHTNSMRSTDSTTAQQIDTAINSLAYDVLVPLCKLGIPLRVIAVTGNHDWDDHGIDSFAPGHSHFSYVIYNGVNNLLQALGYSINFKVCRGAYQTVKIGGANILYEHGYKVTATERSMRSHRAKRMEQCKEYIDYFRMGDKHNVTTFNSCEFVVNGAFFGTDKEGSEYNSQLGYSSYAGQWMGLHKNKQIVEQYIINLCGII